MVVKRAFAESRPYLLLSLFFGISYFFVRDTAVPGLYQMLWKGAGVGFLALYAWRRHAFTDGILLSMVMAFGALGDMVIEGDLIQGAVVFCLGHFVAIGLYLRNRRDSLAFSQRLFAIILIPLTAYIAWMLPADRSMATGVGIYAAIVATMAALAWTSRFPRYRTGVGAVMFVVSDLLIFAEMGPLAGSWIPHMLIWPLYYFGQFLICTGVIQTLRQGRL